MKSPKQDAPPADRSVTNPAWRIPASKVWLDLDVIANQSCDAVLGMPLVAKARALSLITEEDAAAEEAADEADAIAEGGDLIEAEEPSNKVPAAKPRKASVTWRVSRKSRCRSWNEGFWRLNVITAVTEEKPFTASVDVLQTSDGGLWARVGIERHTLLPEMPADLTGQLHWHRDLIKQWRDGVAQVAPRAKAENAKAGWENMQRVLNRMLKCLSGWRSQPIWTNPEPFGGPETLSVTGVNAAKNTFMFDRGGGASVWFDVRWTRDETCTKCDKGILVEQRCMGHCCEGFCVGRGHDFKQRAIGYAEILAENPEHPDRTYYEEGVFIADMILPINPSDPLYAARCGSEAEAKRLASLPDYDETNPKTHGSWTLSSCKHFCRETRNCTVFESPQRPSMCSKYPNGEPCIIPGCTRTTRFCECVKHDTTLCARMVRGILQDFVTGKVLMDPNDIESEFIESRGARFRGILPREDAADLNGLLQLIQEQSRLCQRCGQEH